MANKVPPTNKKVFNKKFILTIVAALTTVAILCAGVYLLLNGGAMTEQGKMESYLRDKYGEAFTVNHVVYKNSGLGVEGIWEADGRSKNSQYLTFKVSGYRGQYSDQYIASIWSAQETENIQTKVKEIYNSNTQIDVRVEVVLSQPLVDSATKKSPTLDEARKLDNGFLYRLIIRATSEPNNQEAASKFYELAQYVQSSGVKRIKLDYSGKDTLGSSYSCVLFDEQLAEYNENSIKDCIKLETR